MSLVPPDVLTQDRIEVTYQFDGEADWYPEVPIGTKLDIHGEGELGAPTTLPARIVQRTEEFYDAHGQRTVSASRIYLPLGTEIGPNDRLGPKGFPPLSAGPILEIANVPTIGTPMMVRIRLGAA